METMLFLLVVFLTNVIQGITGFAGTVLAMPFSIMLFGIDVAKPSLTILTTLACVFIVARNYRDIAWKSFIKMFALMFIGVFAGELIYNYIQTVYLLRFYAAFIIVIAAMGLVRKSRDALPEIFMNGVVVVAGIIHGMFISGGPLLILYAAQKLPDKQSFRATLSLLWISLNCYLMFKQYSSGLMTHSTLMITGLAVPALIAGVFLGGILAKKMSQDFFLKLTYILLIVSGASLLFQ